MAKNSPPMELWNDNTYLAVWVAQRCVLLLFWVVATYSATLVFKPEVYDPMYMIQM